MNKLKNKLNKLNELMEKYNGVLRLAEVGAVIAGVCFIAFQTWYMSQNISDIQKWLELEKGSAIYRHTDLINSVLIEHPKLAEGFDLTQQDVLAYMIIAEFAKLFHLHEKGMIEGPEWDALKDVMKVSMNREWVKEVWVQRKGDGRGTTEEFEKFIETLAYSDD
ncbi:hypothetical protein [Candidatus Thiosymbion oneisti]|uniref:hypothetical protein n=1 Tax=Candidatus Thiosymbion oneisti TaxID=589554 RepID=UPI00105C43AC|nr:hypothetical protein [Candidatus Thiosymbion oneisti]